TSAELRWIAPRANRTLVPKCAIRSATANATLSTHPPSSVRYASLRRAPLVQHWHGCLGLFGPPTHTSVALGVRAYLCKCRRFVIGRARDKVRIAVCARLSRSTFAWLWAVLARRDLLLLAVIPIGLLCLATALREIRGPYYLGANSDPDYAYLFNSLNVL